VPFAATITVLAIVWDQIVIENTLLAVIIVASIYFERWLEEKRVSDIDTKKRTINFIINECVL
jgi:hypothetical protein